MKEVEKISTLNDQLASLISGMGYEFVGCERRNQLLRIYIDSANGITVDDCSVVSRQVSAMLDVEDVIQGQYTLEISSPGLNRPLFDLGHYQKCLGNQVKIRLHTPVGNRRNFAGKLLRIEGMDVYLLVDAEEVAVPFSSIEKANVIADIQK